MVAPELALIAIKPYWVLTKSLSSAASNAMLYAGAPTVMVRSNPPTAPL